MKAWEDLVSLALIGTGKGTGLPADFRDSSLEKLFAEIQGSSVEDSVLKRSGAASLWFRNGRQPKRFPITGSSVAEEETLPMIGSSAAGHLSMMLSGTHSSLLSEWLLAAGAHGLRVPPELLSPLLEGIHRNPKLRTRATPVLGKRGEWLAGQNPEWSIESGDAETGSLWETGSSKERAELLRKTHQSDPSAALTLLSAVWDQEPAALRKEFIEVLGLSPHVADEPFLEKALNDKSKEVKRAAAEVLSLISSSALNQRMQARAEGLMQFKPSGLLSKAKIDFAVPDSIDAAMTRDGIEVKTYVQSKRLGEKAAALMLILASVHPQVWAEKTGMTPEALIKSAAQSEWALSILSGWAAATVRFASIEWAEAFLCQAEPCDLMVSFGNLVRLLPEARRAGWLIGRIENQSISFADENDGRLIAVLDSFENTWPEQLTRRVLPMFRTRMEEEKVNWALTQFLPRFAQHIPHELANNLSRDWKPAEQASSSLEKFWEILRFRHDMHQALKQTPSPL